MNKKTFTNEIREFIATMAWKTFLWARGLTEDQYWGAIARQEISYCPECYAEYFNDCE